MQMTVWMVIQNDRIGPTWFHSIYTSDDGEDNNRSSAAVEEYRDLRVTCPANEQDSYVTARQESFGVESRRAATASYHSALSILTSLQAKRL